MQSNHTFQFEKLIAAMKSQDAEQFSQILNTNPELLQSKNEKNETLLHVALRIKALQFIPLIIEKLKTINKQNLNIFLKSKDSNFNTILHNAANYADLTTFNLIKNLVDDQFDAMSLKVNKERQIPIMLTDENKNKDADKIRKVLADVTIKYPNESLRNPIEVDILVDDEKLRQNLNAAFLAGSDARNAISQSLSHESSNYLDKKNFKILKYEINALQEKCEKELKLFKMLNNQVDKNRLNLMKLNSLVENIKKSSFGNCLEMSFLVFDHIIKSNLNIPVEIVEIKNGSHVFVVLDKDPNGKIEDYTTWGKSAVVIDAWAGKVYPAERLPENLKDFILYENKENEIRGCISVAYDSSFHQLKTENTVKLDASYFSKNEKLDDLNRSYLADMHLAYQIAKIELEKAKNQIPSQQLLELEKLLSDVKTNIDLEKFNKKFQLYKALEEITVNQEIQLKFPEIYSSPINGVHPLFFAIQENHHELLDYLLEKNFCINTFSSVELLNFAIEKENVEAIKIMINHGFTLNEKIDGSPIFFNALSKGCKMTEVFLNNGVDISATNQFGQTALHQAVLLKDSKVVEMLLDAKANVNAVTNNGATALYLASQQHREDVVKILLKFNANPNSVHMNSMTPITIAAKDGKIEIVKLLAENGANIDEAIKISAKRKHWDIYNFLNDSNFSKANKESNENTVPSAPKKSNLLQEKEDVFETQLDINTKQSKLNY